MAKKRRKPSAYILAKRARKAERERQERTPTKHSKQPRKQHRLQCVLLHTQLRPIIREAARAGLVEAIEHTSNFWNVSDGYKKYIDQQIALQAEALMAAVKTALREELTQSFVRAARRKR